MRDNTYDGVKRFDDVSPRDMEVRQLGNGRDLDRMALYTPDDYAQQSDNLSTVLSFTAVTSDATLLHSFVADQVS